MKKCFKCKQEKPLDCFYVHPRMKDGHLNKCIECNKIDAIKHRVANIEKVKAYDHSRAMLPHRKAARLDYQTRSRREFPEKYKARNIVANAIRDGKLERKPCEVCEDTEAEAHHGDYSRPLDVRWLCRIHHMEDHRKYDYAKVPELTY